MIKAALVGTPEAILYVYGKGCREELAAKTELLPEVVRPCEIDSRLASLAEVEAIFSTWGMPEFTQEQIQAMPKLRVVFYAAGSVTYFARPLLANGIKVVSAWHANAVPVAEFTLAQILLSLKGYHRNICEYDGSVGSSLRAFRGKGCYGETVALLGAGAIGRKLIELLRPHRLRVVVFDPFLTESAACELGVEKVSLEEAFSQAYVVSNHLADKPATEGLIAGRQLCEMREHATFINTGRGRTVNHADLIEVLTRRLDLTALLDVTDPEPLPEDSPLRRMRNVVVSSHIAGSINDEVIRMADFCLEELDHYLNGTPLQYLITELD